MERVQKIMSNNGYCSRRKAEELIKEGRVKVNDKVITIGDQASEDDEIKVDDKVLKKVPKIYVKFHKPKGCVTALRDRYEKTIMDYINIKERVFPVGRLDKDTSGLLLLTNDGDFANHIIHPSNEVKKTYLVGLFYDIDKEKIKRLEQGVELEDGKTRPSKIKVHHKKLIEIEIHEGKHHIIKRMFKKINHPVKFLKRIKIGKLNLGKLPEGKYAFLKVENGDKWPLI